VSPESILATDIERALERRGGHPLIFGMCGAQGSGKSTLARALAGRFPRAVALSIDDFYLTRAERLRLAKEVHPLLATRGVPGTHDLDLANAVLTALERGEPVALPVPTRRDPRVRPRPSSDARKWNEPQNRDAGGL